MSQGYTLQSIINSAFNFIFYRYGCAISDTGKQELIITGGIKTISTVSVYSKAGWQRDLAPLNQGRYDHACGSYVNRGKQVKIILCIYLCMLHSVASFSWSLADMEPLILTAQRSSVIVLGGLWLENCLIQ